MPMYVHVSVFGVYAGHDLHLVVRVHTSVHPVTPHTHRAVKRTQLLILSGKKKGGSERHALWCNVQVTGGAGQQSNTSQEVLDPILNRRCLIQFSTEGVRSNTSQEVLDPIHHSRC